MINVHTKFETSIFINYENINGDTKCGKMGGLGQLGVTEGQRK